LDSLADKHWQASPLINGRHYSGEEHPVRNPADNRLTVGSMIYADKEVIEQALNGAEQALLIGGLSPQQSVLNTCRRLPIFSNNIILNWFLYVFAKAAAPLKTLWQKSGKPWIFCRYYAQSALELFNVPIILPGPTGEEICSIAMEGAFLFVSARGISR